MKVKTIFILLMALVFAEKILTHEESIQRHKDVLSSKFLFFQNEVYSFMYGSGPTNVKKTTDQFFNAQIEIMSFLKHMTK